MRGRPFEKGKSGNPGGRPRVLAVLRDLARAHAPEAIEELARLALKARSEAARIAAIRELLDRGYGKSPQSLSDDDLAVSDGAPKAEDVGIRVVFVRPRPRHEDDEDVTLTE